MLAIFIAWRKFNRTIYNQLKKQDHLPLQALLPMVKFSDKHWIQI